MWRPSPPAVGDRGCGGTRRVVECLTRRPVGDRLRRSEDEPRPEPVSPREGSRPDRGRSVVAIPLHTRHVTGAPRCPIRRFGVHGSLGATCTPNGSGADVPSPPGVAVKHRTRDVRVEVAWRSAATGWAEVRGVHGRRRRCYACWCVASGAAVTPSREALISTDLGAHAGRRDPAASPRTTAAPT